MKTVDMDMITGLTLQKQNSFDDGVMCYLDTKCIKNKIMWLADSHMIDNYEPKYWSSVISIYIIEYMEIIECPITDSLDTEKDMK